MIKYFFLLLSFFSIVGCNNQKETNINTTESSVDMPGEQLFRTNCSQCHLPNKDFVGPALAGVESRWKSKELLYEFIKNSQAVINKDEYAKALFIKWKQTAMLPYPQLSDADIDAILSYNRTVSGK
jgi:mono/diheme cytochrome c family protein